jgi:hypothetical protein
MRRICLFVLLTVVASVVVSSHAGASPTILARYQLDNPPSWQTADQKLNLGAWVKHSSPIIVDLGQGPVILVANQGGKLYALKYASGAITKLWSADIGTFIDSSPAVGDINGDGCPEILVGAGNGNRPLGSGVHVFDCRGRKLGFWTAPAQPNGPSGHVGVFSTPAIGDITGDGKPEVVYGSFNTKIYAKDGWGHNLSGWPRPNYDTVWSSPAMADINKDGKRDAIIGTDLGGGAAVLGCPQPTRGTISAFKGSGRFVSTFPRCLDTPIWSSPAVQDLNGDGWLDIVVGTNNYKEYGANVGGADRLRAFDTRTGSRIWTTRFMPGTRIMSSPAIGDVGGDGQMDVAVGTIDNDGGLYLLDSRTGHIRWRRHVPATCSACQFMGPPVIADVTGDGKAEVVANSQDGGLNVLDQAGNWIVQDLHMLQADGTGYESYMLWNAPAIGDLDGDGKAEIVIAGGVPTGISQTNYRIGKVWVLGSEGHGGAPWPFFKKNTKRLSAK